MGGGDRSKCAALRVSVGMQCWHSQAVQRFERHADLALGRPRLGTARDGLDLQHPARHLPAAAAQPLELHGGPEHALLLGHEAALERRLCLAELGEGRGQLLDGRRVLRRRARALRLPHCSRLVARGLHVEQLVERGLLLGLVEGGQLAQLVRHLHHARSQASNTWGCRPPTQGVAAWARGVAAWHEPARHLRVVGGRRGELGGELRSLLLHPRQ